MDKEFLQLCQPEGSTAADLAVAIQNVRAARADAYSRATAARAAVKAGTMPPTARQDLLKALAGLEADVDQYAGIEAALQARLPALLYAETRSAAEVSFSFIMGKLNRRMSKLDREGAPPETLPADLVTLARKIAAHNEGVARGHYRLQFREHHLRFIGALKFCESEAGREFICRATRQPNDDAPPFVMDKVRAECAAG